MEIAGVKIGPDQPCRVVAELSNSHNGDLGCALELIEEAKHAGADLVKFQAYTPDELIQLRGAGAVPAKYGDITMRDLYTKAQTPLKWFPELIRKAEAVGIPWFASVFGLGSLAVMEALGCPAYKLASLDYGSRKLHHMVKATGKPMIRSCPNGRAPKSDALMMYCPPGYPQPEHHLRDIANGYRGFSYHGTSPWVPALAATQGAEIVECHIQLADSPSELEADFCLTDYDFATLVLQLRAWEDAR